jgi:hypothetical protein
VKERKRERAKQGKRERKKQRKRAEIPARYGQL